MEVTEFPEHNSKYAENQPEYNTLPVYKYNNEWGTNCVLLEAFYSGENNTPFYWQSLARGFNF